MDMIYRFLSRLRSLVGRDSKERELRDELAFHIELETEKNMRDGLSAEEARRRALVAFGGVEAWSESVRDERSFRWLDDVVSDGRYAIRGFRRSPGFVAVAVLTLGLGIGALTGIVTVVNSVLLRALPYPAAEELAVIYARKPEWNVSQRNISYPDYLSWKRDQAALEVDPGFEPEGLLTGDISLPDARYPRQRGTTSIHRQATEAGSSTARCDCRRRDDPAAIRSGPWRQVIRPEGYEPSKGESLVAPNYAIVGPSYFDAMGVELAVAALMMTVGLLACAVPAMRALRIQPTAALRKGV
ncbi:MAG: permease prefix domain 1-containing protein [Vicinamibacteraceae bacterium]